MQFIHQSALYLHVLVGAFALLLFWVPVFTRKGSLDHRRFGRVFARAMYVISLSGITMSGMDLLFPAIAHALPPSLSLEQFSQRTSAIRQNALFLFSLSILVHTTTRHGWLTINLRQDRAGLRTPAHLLLCGALLVTGLVLVSLAVVIRSPLFMVFGILEMVVAGGALRYAFKRDLAPKEWWIEHLGSLIGSGIGAYTAFFVFGGATLLDELTDTWSLVLWVGPAVVGTLAIALTSRHYRRRFARQNPTAGISAAGAGVGSIGG